MPKLISLNEQYKDKGLEMIFVGYESRAKLEPYAQKYKITWPVAIEPSKKAQKAYGVRGFPSSFVVAPDGKIAWQGHPASKDLENVIKGLLPKVKKNAGKSGSDIGNEPTRISMKEGLGERLQLASSKAARGNLGSARRIAKKVLDDTGSSDSDKEDANYVNKEIEKRIKELFEKVEKLLKEKNPYEARSLLKEIKKAFSGEAEADKAEAMIVSIDENPDFSNEIQAGELFSKAQYHLERKRPSNAKNYLKQIIEKYPDTTFAKKAKEEIEKLDK